MTTNYHTPIPTSSPVTAAVFNDRLQDLDEGLTNQASGASAMTGLNLGAATTLTIASGVVVRTRARHLIDTEASAATDDLTTINGGANGDRLIISAANTARSVVIKHGTGNIKTASKLDITLDDSDVTVEFQYDGAAWQQVSGELTTSLSYPTATPFRRPTGVPVMMSMAARNFLAYRAAAATVQPIGIAAPTITGNAAANQTDSTYISHTTGAVIGNSAGTVTATYNLVRRSHNPKLSMVIAFADLLAIRAYFGFFSAAVTTVDTVAGATECAAFRYSTVAGDTGFTPVTKDATTQTTGSSLNTMAINTRYNLDIELTPTSAIFTLNNGTPTVITSNLPQTATELGFNMIIFCTSAVARAWYFSRLFCEFD